MIKAKSSYFVSHTSLNTSHNEAPVAILMATLDGELYLSEQLDSLENQEYKNWRLIVSDDGSTDRTLEILQARQMNWGADKLDIKVGAAQGFAFNFMSLAVDPEIEADYFAFCDQDDYWLPEKLSKAIQTLQTQALPSKPNLYCGRTIYTDSQLNKIGMSPLFVHPRSFRNALVQSIAGGNNMVFDTNYKKLLETVGLVDIVSYDW